MNSSNEMQNQKQWDFIVNFLFSEVVEMLEKFDEEIFHLVPPTTGKITVSPLCSDLWYIIWKVSKRKYFEKFN